MELESACQPPPPPASRGRLTKTAEVGVERTDLWVAYALRAVVTGWESGKELILFFLQPLIEYSLSARHQAMTFICVILAFKHLDCFNFLPSVINSA